MSPTQLATSPAPPANDERPDWEEAIAELLEELSQTQDELLAVLREKRRAMGNADITAMTELCPREEAVARRLRACHDRRGELLAQARQRGLPSDSIRGLSRRLGRAGGRELAAHCDAAARQSRLLTHESLSNWVVAQQSLLHLAQLIEIIGAGGRQKPTYGRDESACAGGALVDHAV